MADLKTKQTSRNVEEFINGIFDRQRRKDCRTVLQLMKEITKAEPKMWGDSIVGFGSYPYKYRSGREGVGVFSKYKPGSALPPPAADSLGARPRRLLVQRSKP